MLYRELLTTELDKQREDFQRFAESQAGDLKTYLAGLRLLSETDYAEICRKLADKNAGALPSNELLESEFFAFPFKEKWANHEEAREWANEILSNRTTFAADGSQLYVEKDISLPVGAIQIGWFENPHDATQRYEKNAYFEILSPETLLENQEEPVVPETRVGELRFHAEINKINEFLRKKKDWRENNEKMPLAFFDNTLLFTLSLSNTAIERNFLQATIDMVKLSRELEVPVIGYVDRSYAKDLINMLKAVYGKSDDGR
ncbi:MAG: DNA double-strand break repair nuclease NurA, partial [Pyrinomonadaceae bacterium]